MQRVVGRTASIVGVLWFSSWFALYLEIYRYQHVIPSRIAEVLWPPTAGMASYPGAFVRTVVVWSALAPVLYTLLRVWLRIDQHGRSSATHEPSVTLATIAIFLGIGLCALGGLNQLIRQPPFVIDLTLKNGNGGFLVLGAALAIAGIVAAGRQRATGV